MLSFKDGCEDEIFEFLAAPLCFFKRDLFGKLHKDLHILADAFLTEGFFGLEVVGLITRGRPHVREEKPDWLLATLGDNRNAVT